MVTYCRILNKKKKPTKTELLDIENRQVVGFQKRRWGSEMGEGGQQAQNSSYKISHWDVIHSWATKVNTVFDI